MLISKLPVLYFCSLVVLRGLNCYGSFVEITLLILHNIIPTCHIKLQFAVSLHLLINISTYCTSSDVHLRFLAAASTNVGLSTDITTSAASSTHSVPSTWEEPRDPTALSSQSIPPPQRTLLDPADSPSSLSD